MYILDYQTLNGFIEHTAYIAKRIKKVTERTNYTLDALSSEYTQQASTESFRFFVECVQRLEAIPHNNDYVRE